MNTKGGVMKYVMTLIATFFVFFDITSSNLCWFFENNNNPRLTRRTISHNAACSCECWQYPHTKGTNNQYKCTNCNHRLTPPDPLSAEGPQFIRYNQNQEETNIDRELEINNAKVLPAARTLQNPLNQQWREKASFPDLARVDQRRSD